MNRSSALNFIKLTCLNTGFVAKTWHVCLRERQGRLLMTYVIVEGVSQFVGVDFWPLPLVALFQGLRQEHTGPTVDIWSVWGDSDEVRNKYVWRVQLSEPRGRCRLRLSMRSLRRRAVGRLSHWILWLVVCQLNGRSDWRCASKSAWCVGGQNTVRTPFHHSPCSCFAVMARDKLCPFRKN